MVNHLAHTIKAIMVGVQSVHMVVTHLVDGGIAATFILQLWR